MYNLNLPFDTENFNVTGFLSKTFKKIRASVRGSYTYANSFQFFGGRRNEVDRNIYSVGPSINTNFQKAPNISLRYNVSFNNQLNKDIDTGLMTENSAVTHAPIISFDAYIWDALTIRTDYSFNEVRQDGIIQNKFNIWNFTMAYRKDRDAKWEYELVGDNLLGTASRASVSFDNISNINNEIFILPRFVSLRVRYSL